MSSQVISQIHPQKTIRGIVRAVNSGDSLTIQEVDTVKGEFLSKQEYLLSTISVPRLGRPATADKAATQDEPFAWESREFLRKKCIGKRVSFIIDYTAPTGKPYITAYLVDDSDNSINKQMIEFGWATLYKSKKPDQDLVIFESDAISKQLGVHNKNPVVLEDAVRPIHNISNFDLYNQLKGKQLDALVEYIRNVTSFRVAILPSHHQIQIQLSAVQCPGIKKEGNDDYVVDADNLLANNVLHREVKLTLDTFDKAGNLFGTIRCDGRDVAEELLRQGMCTYVAWSAVNRTTSEQVSLKNAESIAKQQRLRLWSLIAPAPSATTSSSSTTTTSTSGDNDDNVYPEEINGKVIEVGNNGQITIQKSNKKDYKISLASLKLPNFSKVSDEENKMEKEKQAAISAERYWGFETKEWLRKRLIGKEVVAKLDFVRPEIKANDLPEKPFYSVYQNQINISIALVEAGLAKVAEHKGADNRAIDYEALILAENKAKSKGLGLHNTKQQVRYNINDLSLDNANTKARAVTFLPHTRNHLNNAVIDYVFSGQRFKVYLPKELSIINFSLSGVRVPKRGESTENDEISNSALLFSRDILHQRDVQVQIEDIDKGGNFLGSLYFNNKNFAITLIENGWASLNDPYNKLAEHKALEDAENRAKAKRLNMWKSYDPEAEKREQEEKQRQVKEKEAKEKAESKKEVIVSSVISANELYVRPSQPTQEIEEMFSNLSVDAGSSSQNNFRPAVNDIVNAKFEEEQKWFRAKVTSIENSNYTIQFIDYGNTTKVTIDKLRPLSMRYATIPAQSYVVQLAYVKGTSNEDYNYSCMDFLEDEILGNIMTQTLIYKDNSGRSHVVLEDSQGSLNEELLRNGLVQFDRNAQRNHSSYVCDKMEEEQQNAKKKRLGIWKYGDAGGSDDEDDRRSFNQKRGGKVGGKGRN